MIPIYKPYLPSPAKQFALAAIESGWISSRGPYVDLVTDELHRRYGHKHIVLTNSGTAAGHLVAIALKACRPSIRSLIVPNNVYVAAWNTLLMEYEAEALTARDADIDTWNMSADGPVCTDPEHEALLVVHNVGNVVPVPMWQRLGGWKTVIEDACEAFGSTYVADNEPVSVGRASLAASLSFFANKTVTSGCGGALVTDDEDAYHIARRTADQGITDRRYVHDCHGYSYRMTNVEAALLYGQLHVLPKILEHKERIYKRYRAELSGVPNIRLQQHESPTTNVMWMMGVRVIGSSGYDDVERFMKWRGVEIRPMFYPITAHKHLRDVRVTGTAVAELLHKECFMVPSFPALTPKEQGEVIDAVKTYAESV